MAGLVMPAEWGEHQATLMEFPVFWKPGGLDSARASYAKVAAAISRFERVVVIANPGDEAKAARRLLPGEAEVLELPHDDAWARDNCPEFALDESGSLCAVDWKFNAWGMKYPNWELDDAVPKRLCDLWGIPRTEAPLVLEGGSVHTNGEGTLLTTAECLLNPNRNPEASKERIEACLKELFGASRVVWLPYGLPGDETDGHVDNVCCFINPLTVLLHGADDARTRAAAAALSEAGLRVETLPAPEDAGLPAASYINFSFANGGVVMPGFGVPSDAEALEKMRGLLPGREVVQIQSLDILAGGGNIHCITRHVPKAKERRHA